MRIAVIQPERVTSERVAPEVHAVWAVAESLVEMGLEIRVVTRGVHEHPTLFIRGRFSEHAMPRAPQVGGWERETLGFAAAAAKRVWEWHEGDEIDVVEIPVAIGAAITLARGCIGDGPPVVISTPMEAGVFGALAAGGADAAASPLASPGDRISAYSAALARRWAAGRSRHGTAAEPLSAWRAAQETLSRAG